MNERITENIVRNFLQKQNYYDNPDIIVDEQKSSITQIDKLLQNASKKGSGKGYPEFIIKSKSINNFVIVIECKADITKHESKNLDKYADYAVDGAKLYSDYLSKEFDVLFVGISGQNEKELKISHYFQLKGEKEIKPAFDNQILDWNSYIETYKQVRFRVDYQELFKYVRTLNEKLHQKKIPEDKRGILFSCILIALEDETFLNTYTHYTNAQRLGDYLVSSVIQKLKDSNINQSRVSDMEHAFTFIKTHTALIDEGYLIELIKDIHDNIRSFIKNNEYFDIISQVYTEFLRYANNDSGLGIVLTPPHITDLFCELAGITKDSVVFDNCCGTGGFLVSAMDKMVKLAKGDLQKIEHIKKNQLIGIEYQDHIFTLSCLNMILHGDGKTNIIKGDCFKKIDEIKKFKPTIGLLNPPYQSEKNAILPMSFILNNLEAFSENGVVVAIIPLSSILATKGVGLELKQKLLSEHTLDAVISMNDNLFDDGNVGVNTCIVIIKAHQPHPTDYKTYFGYWKKDGFIKTKNLGRIDSGKWGLLKKEYINSYFNKENMEGLSIKHLINANDEWCVENYIQTSYSELNKPYFEDSLKKFIAFNVVENENFEPNKNSVNDKNLELNTQNWKWFCYDNIFNISRGASSDEISDNKTLLIGASQNHNGSNEEFNNYNPYYNDIKITVGNGGNTGCGQAFLQNLPFNAKSTVNILDLKNYKLNNFIGIFVVTLIKLEQFKFNFGRGWSLERMKKSQIKLPATTQGEPDWQFMENYIKSLPYSSSL